ncbi:MAG: hypothetical protein ACK463_13465, partial [Bradyrhizobium sp.]
GTANFGDAARQNWSVGSREGEIEKPIHNGRLPAVVVWRTIAEGIPIRYFIESVKRLSSGQFSGTTCVCMNPQFESFFAIFAR